MKIPNTLPWTPVDSEGGHHEIFGNGGECILYDVWRIPDRDYVIACCNTMPLIVDMLRRLSVAEDVSWTRYACKELLEKLGMEST